MRKKPYTQIGIRRLKCIRCGDRAESQWQVCADGNQYRPICVDCDIELNALVLAFMNVPEAPRKLLKYKVEKGRI